jgi:phospho-N-acetylmuramoyl-pentapeptide-transferase
VLFLMTGLGSVGFVDDYIKIFKQRSLGLRARTKLFGQAACATVFAVLALRFPDAQGLTPASDNISLIRDSTFALGGGLFIIWAYLMIAGMSNGVNLTDGLDGLATGACVMTFAAYVVIGVWQRAQSCALAIEPRCYEVRDPIDLAIVAAALAGACFGFLWWNASPARHLHGRHGLTRARWRHRRPGHPQPHRAAVRAPRRALRPDHALGRPSGRLPSS